MVQKVQVNKEDFDAIVESLGIFGDTLDRVIEAMAMGKGYETVTAIREIADVLQTVAKDWPNEVETVDEENDESTED